MPVNLLAQLGVAVAPGGEPRQLASMKLQREGDEVLIECYDTEGRLLAGGDMSLIGLHALLNGGTVHITFPK